MIHGGRILGEIMLSTMALPNEYTVTWNIGNFGHLIKAIIGIEIYNLSVVSEGADTHDVTSGMHGMIDIIHPYESSKIKKDMKRYSHCLFDPLHLNINMYILHTVSHTSPKV